MQRIILAAALLSTLVAPAAASNYFDVFTGQETTYSAQGFAVVSDQPLIIARISEIEAVISTGARSAIYLRSGSQLPSNLSIEELIERVRQAQ